MRIFAFVSVLLLAVAFLCDRSVKAQPGENAQSQQILATNRQKFNIPFELNLPKEFNREIELIFSRDRGTNWYLHSRIGPDKKQFAVEAESDGEYWFIIRTVGDDGVARAPDPSKPSMKVLLDTRKPDVELELKMRPEGDLEIDWSISDLHLSQRFPSVYCSYHLPGGEPDWKPLAIDPGNVRSRGTEHAGKLFLRPPGGTSHLEIRCEASDMAGNIGSKSASLALFKPVEENRIGKIERDGQIGRIEEERSSSRDLSSTPLAPPQAMYERPDRKIADNYSSRIPPRPLNNPYSGGDGFVIPGDANELEPLKLPENPESSPSQKPEKTEKPENSTEKNVNDFDSYVGPSLGIDLGPLPGITSPSPKNADFGPKYAGAAEILDTDPILAVDPLGFDFGEPAFVRISPSILAPPRLTPHEEPTEKVEIPTQKISLPPVGKIEYVSLEVNVPLPYIVLEWNTGPHDWAGATTAVYRGPSENGPWSPILERIDNTGKHSWYIGEADMKPFFIRLEIENPDGRRSGDTTLRPILIEPGMFRRN